MLNSLSPAVHKLYLSVGSPSSARLEKATLTTSFPSHLPHTALSSLISKHPKTHLINRRFLLSHSRGRTRQIWGQARSDSFSRLSHHTWELMNSVDDEFESPKLRKLIISSLNSNLWAKPDLNRIVDRLSGSALKLEKDYEFVRVEQEEEGWDPFSYKAKQPLWKHLFEESLLSSLDPRIVSSYKKALSS
ncbi:unnamed protein product [Brassica oleracea]